MTGLANHWKQRAESMFASLHSIDRSWFPDAFRDHTKLMDAAAMSTMARRMLYSYLPAAEQTNVQGEILVPDWACLDAANTRRLVLRLGAFACATALRQTIEQAELLEVRNAIDDETYRAAIEQPVAPIKNDIRAEFRAALKRGELRHFIAAIGMSVLQSAVPEDEAFIQYRLRFHFPRKAWAQRRAGLVCRIDHVIDILNRDGHAQGNAGAEGA